MKRGDFINALNANTKPLNTFIILKNHQTEIGMIKTQLDYYDRTTY
jgi:hypothetical protein